jgi:hypothetical protein
MFSLFFVYFCIAVPMTGLIPTQYCACLKLGPGLSTTYVVGFFCWIICLICWHWWNWLLSILILSFHNTLSFRKVADRKHIDQFIARISTNILDLPCNFANHVKCDATYKYRTINGLCNNLGHPRWGMSLTPFDRFLQPDYDGKFTTQGKIDCIWFKCSQT